MFLLRRIWTLLVFAGAALGYVLIRSLNAAQAPVTFVYWPGRAVETSLANLAAVAFGLGLFVALVIGFLRDARRAIRAWREGRRTRRLEVARDLYHEGCHHVLLGNLDKARQLLQQSLDKDPSKPNVYIRLADLAAQDEDFATAIQMLERARLVSPGNLEAHFKLAHYMRAAGDARGAVRVLEQVLELDATNRSALRELRELYVDLGDWERAYRAQRELVRLSPGGRSAPAQQELLVGLKYERARALVERGDEERAEKLLRELVKETPTFRPAHVTLGDLLYRQGDSEGAAEVWYGAFRLSGDPLFLQRLEEMYLAEADPAKILALYQQAVAAAPDDLRLRLFYAKLCLRLEMVEEAAEALEQIEATGADTFDLRVLLAEAYRRRERFEDAVDQFQRALQLGGRIDIPLVCQRCLAVSPSWSARCPSCGSWDTLRFRGLEELERARQTAGALPAGLYRDL
ncbi:MAG TPA: tetratricopeptide repeat protein [Thermodesulfobacteriota bacterium]|nr:tetratricopeptide repeat protein [Thermodesulfobacteriota bacterium]